MRLPLLFSVELPFVDPPEALTSMSNSQISRIRVIDSHTGGEPTRVIVKGGPELGAGTMAERLEIFKKDFDHIRSAVVNEPRGSDVVVGALLCEPVENDSTAGVIFFNNVGYLGMCGHGTIGLVATLAHMGRIGTGVHIFETPVGKISAELHSSGDITVTNVPSFRLSARTQLEIDGYGTVFGDVAYGGNWFFLVSDHGHQLDLANVDNLSALAWKIRTALNLQGITGSDGSEIDHVELFGPPESSHADSRNFVLCPGGAYDRSPCGTGTSAKLACLYADGKLAEGQVWRQESIVGSIFEGSFSLVENQLYPHIKGSAFVGAEAELILDPRDPFCFGIRR